MEFDGGRRFPSMSHMRDMRTRYMSRMSMPSVSSHAARWLFVLPIMLIVITIVVIGVFAMVAVANKTTPIPYWVSALVLGVSASLSTLVFAMLVSKTPCKKDKSGPQTVEPYIEEPSIDESEPIASNISDEFL
jgi:hypothetical protein